MRRYTQDAKRNYYERPDEYQNHRGVFAFVSMVTLLKHPRGLGVGYSPTAIGNYDFSDSRDDLLHGLLTRKLGTCASLPVLFVAIGRRLGYPMHLAVAKGHVFCQWVDERGRFNLEGSCGGGGDCLPDEHYYTRPRPLTRDDLASGRYLRPLTRTEELALFLETRGHCLTDNRRFAEARRAYEQAHRIAPQWSQLHNHLYALEQNEVRPQGVCRFMVRNAEAAARSKPVYPTVNASVPSQGLFPTLTSLPGLTH